MPQVSQKHARSFAWTWNCYKIYPASWGILKQRSSLRRGFENSHRCVIYRYGLYIELTSLSLKRCVLCFVVAVELYVAQFLLHAALGDGVVVLLQRLAAGVPRSNPVGPSFVSSSPLVFLRPQGLVVRVAGHEHSSVMQVLQIKPFQKRDIASNSYHVARPSE